MMCMTLEAAVVMILRLWALYNQSRLILGVLLLFYAMESIAFFISFVILSAHQSQYDPIGKLNYTTS